ncbi:MAG: glycine--tRNA ligase subunit beta [Methylophilales bacterium]|nr:glycine--tRNA ligase subunit beta [Methylophilales bacterium]
MSKHNLLVELLVEELPPKSLRKLGDAFANGVFESLKNQGLVGDKAEVIPYATPRRLAVHISNVLSVAPDQEIMQKLMPVTVAITANGIPTEALRKRLAKEGREHLADLWPEAEDGPDKLYVASDGKTDNVFLSGVAKGGSLQVALQSALADTIAKLPIPKVMSYQLQDGWESVNFVRPAHGLVALHGQEVIQVTALGLASSNLAQGHRFEATKHPIEIHNADSYATQLETEGAVIVSFDARRAEIEKQLAAAALKAGNGLQPIVDDDLLDEVTALVERPNVLMGEFDVAFLEVPQECLILTMKANQKYFPLLNPDGSLSNKFLLVSNITPKDPSAVIEGNERVVRPRLADAKFFFDQDRKKTLAERVSGLDKVVYHNKLGSQGERTQRVAKLAKHIGEQLGGAVLAGLAEQAALLAKADLLTDMVGEFPELQGIMGSYYALHEGLAADIAEAIEDHYKPRFAGDDLPRNMVGTCVALADKLETLVGLFKIGQVPTGDKDPFALRRHALGLIRMLVEQELVLQVDDLLTNATQLFNEFEDDATASLPDFIYERFAGSLRDQGYSPQEVDAVLSLRPQVLHEVTQRLEAVQAFSTLPEAASLAAANKRVGNILKKVEGKVPHNVDLILLREDAEIALYQALGAVKPESDSAFTRGDYTTALKALAGLKAPIDNFFEHVMVNAEDEKLRLNRLGLLNLLHQSMNRVADLSKLAS